jgi:hypothetical protein
MTTKNSSRRSVRNALALRDSIREIVRCYKHIQLFVMRVARKFLEEINHLIIKTGFFF